MEFLFLIIGAIIMTCFTMREDIMYSTRLAPLVRWTLLSISLIMLISLPICAISFAYTCFSESINDAGYVVGALCIVVAISDIIYFIRFVIKMIGARKVREHLIDEENNPNSLYNAFRSKQETQENQNDRGRIVVRVVGIFVLICILAAYVLMSIYIW
jgi:hypothetical protein